MFAQLTQTLKSFFQRFYGQHGDDYLLSSTDLNELESRMRRQERENYGLFR